MYGRRGIDVLEAKARELADWVGLEPSPTPGFRELPKPRKRNHTRIAHNHLVARLKAELELVNTTAYGEGIEAGILKMCPICREGYTLHRIARQLEDINPDPTPDDCDYLHIYWEDGKAEAEHRKGMLGEAVEWGWACPAAPLHRLMDTMSLRRADGSDPRQVSGPAAYRQLVLNPTIPTLDKNSLGWVGQFAGKQYFATPGSVYVSTALDIATDYPHIHATLTDLKDPILTD